DEIEKLADAFNQMASSLNRSFRELERQMGEIRRLEEHYRDLIENSPEMIHKLDQDGRFVHVNTTAIDKLGYTQDEMFGKCLWDIAPAECRQHTENLEQEVARRTKDLMESQERYKILFDEAADSVLMVNPGGGIIAVNRRQEAVLKYPEEELVGRRFLDLLMPKDQPSVAALIHEILGEARKTPTVEVKVLDRSGRAVPMELDLTGIQTGSVTYIMVQLRDITERKRLERQLYEYSESLEVKV